MTESPPVVHEVDLGIFPDDNTWGHRISINNWEKRKIDGHMSPMVEEGQTFGYRMESGKVGVFEITEVERQTDPRDQFFGEVKDVGYLKEDE